MSDKAEKIRIYVPDVIGRLGEHILKYEARNACEECGSPEREISVMFIDEAHKNQRTIHFKKL